MSRNIIVIGVVYFVVFWSGRFLTQILRDLLWQFQDEIDLNRGIKFIGNITPHSTWIYNKECHNYKFNKITTEGISKPNHHSLFCNNANLNVVVFESFCEQNKKKMRFHKTPEENRSCWKWHPRLLQEWIQLFHETCSLLADFLIKFVSKETLNLTG